jgi:hypothetical protein
VDLRVKQVARKRASRPHRRGIIRIRVVTRPCC